MTQHEFLSADRKVQRSVFGEGANAVQVVVNMSGAEYRFVSKAVGDVILPPNGFAIESPRFAAFCALRWDGVQYDRPTLFTLRSLDGKPLADSKQRACVSRLRRQGCQSLRASAAGRKRGGYCSVTRLLLGKCRKKHGGHSERGRISAQNDPA